MKVYSVIEDNIFTYPRFPIRTIWVYLYYFVSWFECACALVANKVSPVCTRKTIFFFSIFERNEDPASGLERMQVFYVYMLTVYIKVW